MRTLFVRMLEKFVGSRKASVFLATTLLNLIVRLLAGVAFELSADQQMQLYAGLEHITDLAMAYIASQAGVDIAQAVKQKQNDA